MQGCFRLKKILLSLLLLTSGSLAQVGTLHIVILDQNGDAVTKGDIYISKTNNSLIAKKTITREPITFPRLNDHEVIIKVESPGFSIYRKKTTISKNVATYVVRLQLKKITTKVDVETSKVERRLNNAFSGILSPEEIATLPDNPVELGKELKRRYGNDLVISVDGFSGGVIPPKAAIRSIHITRSSFDSEFHELGSPRINIITKVLSRKFVGMINVQHTNSALNARNALSEQKLPHQLNSISTYISVPLIREKASFGNPPIFRGYQK